MKFSIVTPVYNGEKYIRETIESILSQEGNFEIEYIIKDGGSTDKTLEVIKYYDEKINNKTYPIKCNAISLKWQSKEDNGMYDAVNKGFDIATGDIYAYLNADDKYERGAFEIINNTLVKYPKILWLKGITSFIKENSGTIEVGKCYIYDREWIKMGVYGRNAYFIHQDSVFWKKELWKKVSKIDSELKLAGDYYLWIKFSQYTELWSVNARVSLFRKNTEQLSHNMELYRKEQQKISKFTGGLNKKIKLFFWLKSKFNHSIFNTTFYLIYYLIFHKGNKHYIEINKVGEPTIVDTYLYVI